MEVTATDRTTEKRPIPRAVFGMVVVVLMSMATFAYLYATHPEWPKLIDAMRGVTDGTPHWRAFQNRLLAPYTILGLSTVFEGYETAYFLFLGVTLILHSVIFCGLALRQSQSAIAAVIAYGVWTALFLVLQHYWLYAWDFLDLIFFTIASYIVVFNGRREVVLLLLPLAFLNRESAVLLCSIFIIDGLTRPPSEADETEPAQMTGSRRFSVVLGCVLIVLGMIYTQVIRDALFVESSFGGDDSQNTLIGNHIHLLDNLDELFIHRSMSVEAFYSFVLIVLTGYFARLYRVTHSLHIKKAVVFYAVMLASNLVFGLVDETRIFFPMISLVIFIVMARREKIARAEL